MIAFAGQTWTQAVQDADAGRLRLIKKSARTVMTDYRTQLNEATIAQVK